MTKNSEIKLIKAREILDSRGNPTIEVELETDSGVFLASVPSGVSRGKHEAVELRDGGRRYQGKGVLKAVNNVNKIIAPKLKGEDVRNQKKIDQILIKLDGTKNKSKLGVNSILGISMAVCRAGAVAKNLPLYQYISKIYQGNNTISTIVKNVLKIPSPCFNIINGGAHAGNELDFQEFMIVPQEKVFSENLRIGTEIYHQLKEILAKKFGNQAINLGDEGGFTPPVRAPEEALDLILEAAKRLGYQNSHGRIRIEQRQRPSERYSHAIILDVAASQFYTNEKPRSRENSLRGRYKMKFGIFTSEGLLRYYSDLIQKYPILGLEDPFAEDDLEGWKKILNLKSKILNLMIIGDDLLATNPERIKKAKDREACNAMILKPNQIGTLTEAIEAAKLAKSFGWKIIVSHRSGETNDDFISDLAVGISADFIKAGAPARGERVAKYNRLLRIEEEIE